MKKLMIVLVALLISCSLIIGCGSTPASTPSTPTSTLPTTSQSPKYGGTMRVVLEVGPPSAGGWPWELIADASSSVQPCIEGLLRSDPKANILPWLAESYKIADDLMSITFNLRKGIKFHDGSDFNAQVAKWNLDNAIAAKRQPYWKSVDIIDDYTVRVNFTQWANTLIYTFADNIDSWMISYQSFQKNGKDWMRDNPIGTGPFKFVSFQRDVSFKCIKNPDYWQKGKPYLDAVECIYITDPLTRTAALATGEGDAVPFEPGKMGADYSALGLTLKSNIITTYCFVPDTANSGSPYANQQVREAVEYAIDREAIAKAFSYGYWTAPYQIPGSAMLVNNPDFSLARKYDVNKAKKLMQEAGYAEGFKSTIVVSPSNVDHDILTAVQRYLALIGIQANVDFPDMGRFQSIANSNTIKSVLFFEPAGGNVNYNRTLQYIFDPSPTSMMNKSWLRSTEYVRLYNISISSPTPDINLIRAVTDQLTKEASVIPIIQAGKSWAIRPSIVNAGFLERSIVPMWRPEEAWINK